MAGARSFIMEGANCLYFAGVAMRVILVGIACGVHMLVTIAARSATFELIVLFSFLVKCWTLHPKLGSYPTVFIGRTESRSLRFELSVPLFGRLL